MDPAVMSVGLRVPKKVHPGPCAIANSAISSWPARPPVLAGGFCLIQLTFQQPTATIVFLRGSATWRQVL
jgi:hypothetical protein